MIPTMRQDGFASAGGIRTILFRVGATVLYRSGLLGLLRCLAERWELIHCDSHEAFPFVRRRRGERLQILTYHRVNDEHDAIFPGVPTQVFARQMEYLSRHYEVWPLDEAVEGLRRKALPDHAIAVTFDDGYRDNYTQAFPVLRSASIPATIFLATDAIGTGRVLWHDRVFEAFRRTNVPVLRGFRTGPSISLRTKGERKDALRQVLIFLRTLDEVEREQRICSLIVQLEVEDISGEADLMLSWEEVSEMSRYRITFGSHTATHPILSRIQPEAVRAQIERSTACIEEKLGLRPRLFAYPNGGREDFTESVKHELKDMGYLAAVTTIFGTNGYTQDLYELRRGGPWEEHLPSFAAKLSWYRFTAA